MTHPLQRKDSMAYETYDSYTMKTQIMLLINFNSESMLLINFTSET